MDEASERERTRVRSRNLSIDKTKEREKRDMVDAWGVVSGAERRNKSLPNRYNLQEYGFSLIFNIPSAVYPSILLDYLSPYAFLFLIFPLFPQPQLD